MKKLQSQGVHHIRSSAPTGRRRSTSRRGARDAVRLRATEPRQPSEGDLYFDPVDGRLITSSRTKNGAQEHLADAIEGLVARSRDSLSNGRGPQNPY
jgi:hypothetical protein